MNRDCADTSCKRKSHASIAAFRRAFDEAQTVSSSASCSLTWMSVFTWVSTSRSSVETRSFDAVSQSSRSTRSTEASASQRAANAADEAS
eukprot:CAMPEP_0184226268 /NCGR_PEP_ID=MMETSP0976-20121227/20663_1 /TAXON_ID=483370 /ORGANISM="non described non described, Strain CCMP2097" /LENGTH=89 /DNA_ID=CAMNT_0026531209 /DNA_START=225 /DNA_END=491 /DNA_ORIENTATION=+